MTSVLCRQRGDYRPRGPNRVFIARCRPARPLASILLLLLGCSELQRATPEVSHAESSDRAEGHGEPISPNGTPESPETRSLEAGAAPPSPADVRRVNDLFCAGGQCIGTAGPNREPFAFSRDAAGGFHRLATLYLSNGAPRLSSPCILQTPGVLACVEPAAAQQGSAHTFTEVECSEWCCGLSAGDSRLGCWGMRHEFRLDDLHRIDVPYVTWTDARGAQHLDVTARDVCYRHSDRTKCRSREQLQSEIVVRAEVQSRRPCHVRRGDG